MVHPSPEEMVQWLRRLGAADRTSLSHLLECPACREQALEELRRQQTEAGLADVLSYRRPAAADLSAVRGEPTQAYHHLAASFDRITRRALDCAEREQQRAGELVDELLAHPAPRREVLVGNSERFLSLAVAQRLLEASHASGFQDPREAERLARLALRIIESVDVAFYGRRLIDDLRARAWAHAGNALRIANRTDEADAAFRRGAAHLEGTADPLEEAGFQHLLSSLRKQQRRFDEAADLMRSAASLYEEVGDTDRLARVLTGLGSSYLDQGTPEAAVEPLLEALRHVDALVDPRTALYIHHNLTVCLSETGRFLEAQRMFTAARPLYERFPDRRTQLQRQWLEGIVAAGTGRAEHAEELFRQVKSAFAEADMPLDAAVAGLDLAALYARQERTADLKALAQELTGALFSGRLHREALAALAYFVQAAQRERATEQVVRKVAGYLRWAEPGSRFRPA